jgi:hypothetical protein
VETVVDQALGDVIHGHAMVGKGAGVQDAFMRHPALVAHEQDRIGGASRGDVVRVQDRHPRRLRQPRPPIIRQ